ncbi:YfiR family protein [Acinetobacter sp. WZC-1]|uniref:YfiR family protein n=1 Tax=Acinetobacter sp. WZC-1 TaxID=3459034 RepID=UPI00403E3638
MTTLSILSYVQWNTPNPVLCIAGNQPTATQFSYLTRQNKYPFAINPIQNADLRKTHCDAVFFTNSTPISEQKLLNTSQNKSILSFSTNNAECEIGSSFCLYSSKSDNTLFKVNLDSLTRSKVHVDPRVLLLARNSEQE